jgi:hypothetical protein
MTPTTTDWQRIRNSVPLPQHVSALFTSQGKLKSEYLCHDHVTEALQRRHRRAGDAVTQNSLPPGVQQALRLPLVWVQIVNRYPWKVMWQRIDSRGRRRRGELLCTTLGGAIKEWRRISRLVPNATIVSRARGYDIPAELRGQLPPKWLWCPHCMKPRRFQRDPDQPPFHAMKKVWRSDKQRYDWVARKVWVVVCPMCGCTNRSAVFRRSNQPWELRRVRRGTTRVSTNKGVR